jgi:hypothetical protein
MLSLNKTFPRRQLNKIGLAVGFSLAVIFTGCGSQNAQQYEATAETTMTWRVKYSKEPTRDALGRYVEFASTSLTNRNGEKPEGGVVQDDKGIWWGKVPAKPSIDEIEAAKKQSYEKIGNPDLLRTVKYYVTYQQDGRTITLPTNHSVYRQVAKAYPNGTPLRFTMGLNNGSVEKATPIN